ncbi:beta-mannosidase [Leifsonia sp. Root227]|uniref:glycoside hydrolase family 2 protein n=1 Tax=Leifsonia sp. Root227 TaxID=1736496 RepID=UPI0006F5F037|nr:glycoside hydrolase family 2 protein [Leifsonia sp. Root227]KRC51913.1 beta-mannosidase [Leifsonia sp. Root227]
MITRTPLTTGWSLDLAATTPDVPVHIRQALPIPATVPGTVHTDLLAAGLIPDPYIDQNELTLDWIGHGEWVYRMTIEREPVSGEQLTIAFDGLDTIATVSINGAVIARTENMHRRHEVDVTGALSGSDVLEVRFASAWDFAEAERERIGALPNAYPAPFNHLRKMACNFGWDWGPTLVTAGIWRDVTLISAQSARLASVSPHVTVAGPVGTARFEVNLSEPAEKGFQVVAEVGGTTAVVDVEEGARSVQVAAIVDNPELWWPVGLGSQPLYTATIQLRHNQRSLDLWESRVGFRSLRLDTSNDEIGSAFVFIINEATVPIRGANWIPDDCFLPRVTEARLRERLTQAVDANINLLRVWGGGVYESETFYRICDELGILVWQDFLFACAAYPEDERLAEEVVAEARDNVQRLLPHPSLVLWNGNNENIWGWFDWDWQPQIGDRSWGLGYYLEYLPAVVAAEDPNRPYWAGSPYSGTMDVHPNADEHGVKHVWDVWNEADYTVYKDYAPRFVSEFGWQGPATYSTIERAVSDRPLTSTSPGMLHHQKANDGNGKLERGLAPHIVVPQEFDDWHFAMQLNQARAVAFGIEHYRSLRPRCFGTIVWQLNDCWPVTSWAAIDGDGRKKPLWYALKSAYASRLLTIQPGNDGIDVVGVNDGGDAWREPITVRRMTLDGRVLATFSARLVADRFAAVRLPLPPEVVAVGNSTSEVLFAETASGRTAWHFFEEDRDLALPEPRYDIRIDRDGDGTDFSVMVTARSFVRSLCLFPDRIHPAAETDSAMINLLPEQSHTFKVSSVADIDSRLLRSGPVLRSANELLRTH